jgi:hypothetical protein
LLAMDALLLGGLRVWMEYFILSTSGTNACIIPMLTWVHGIKKSNIPSQQRQLDTCFMKIP